MSDFEDVPIKEKIGKNRKRLKRKATKELARILKETEFDDFVEFANNFKRASGKAHRLQFTSAVSSDSDEEKEKATQRKKKRPQRFIESKSDTFATSDEEVISESPSLIPSLPVGSEEPPAKIVKKSQTISKSQRIHHKNSSKSNRDIIQSPTYSQSCSTSKDASHTVMHSPSSLQTTKKGFSYSATASVFTRMFKEMDKINIKLNNLNTKVDKLISIQATSQNYATLDFLPTEVKLPLMTEDELKHFNQRLKDDREFSAAMVRYLHGAGSGKTAFSFVLSISKKMLAQELAVKFSRYGRKGKKSISDFNETMTVILAAASTRFSSLDKEKLSELFGKALSGACE
ncbi:hypothetical protein JTE90_009659 [Oedothorax gibbosus]|uniref:DUF4806 domain-containing protein n=1 Tax=Oedothorax gibbosus TaxID=931172 RepID=A0AAV6TVA3_9ARAC|nr:hypothetical protein JTE90_009659 [Oedothorax gibbosus]